MVGAASGIGRWKAFWPLVLLALVVRISFGSQVLPQAAIADAALQLAQISLLCDGHEPGAPRHHPPADAGEGVLLLGDAQACLDLRSEPVIFLGALFTFVVSVWYFPPVRGPPRQKVSALYAQGPPA